MRYDLMAEEVEIDPFVRRSAFPATQEFPVKRPRLAKIAHGKGEVETGTAGHSGFVMFACERSRLCR